MQEIKGNITIATLILLKEEKDNILRGTRNEREKKKVASERFKTNQWLDSDEGSFYNHLTDIVKATDGNIEPKFKSRDSGPGGENVTTTTTTKDEIEEFWRPIWENSRTKVHQDDWIRSVETALKQHIEQPSEESIQVTKDMIFESLKKKRNWSSPGKDKITNFLDKENESFPSRHTTSLNKRQQSFQANWKWCLRISDWRGGLTSVQAFT